MKVYRRKGMRATEGIGERESGPYKQHLLVYKRKKHVIAAEGTRRERRGAKPKRKARRRLEGRI